MPDILITEAEQKAITKMAEAGRALKQAAMDVKHAAYHNGKKTREGKETFIDFGYNIKCLEDLKKALKLAEEAGL